MKRRRLWGWAGSNNRMKNVNSGGHDRNSLFELRIVSPEFLLNFYFVFRDYYKMKEL